MNEEKFDVIVVGAGLAGNTAAYLMAKAGLEVLVIERGETIGGKNVTGGRMYSHSIERIFPDFAKEAPVERKITKERISFMTEDSATTVEYAADKLGEQGKATYSICRAHFDPWLAGKAEEAGAMYVTGIRVDEVLVRDGKVCGVIAGGEEMLSDMVLLADGVNSLLAQQLGMKKELDPSQVAVGVKEIIELDEEKINDRFGAASNEEGTAWLFAGDVSGGNIGGGFIYTNKNSLSVGIVTTIADIGRVDLAPRDMLERLKNHPVVAPLIKGGKVVEYAAHLVTEGGYDMIPTLYRDNVLVAGDAAALVMNLGFTIRGMDLCIESGRLAAETIIAAKEAGDYSAATLSKYKTAMDNSFIIKDMQHFRKMPKFIENHRIFEQYPKMMDEIMSDLFIMYGQKPEKFKKKAMAAVKKVGIMNLLKDGMSGMGAM
ncbi:MAG: FAD-dependent oxidoreductase [Lachnospiraceae bacterium]|nr:FAD-dependent oxidoreductase [Lachnospiraceae bacterium]MDD7026963.1 FAD-dependent oxidoreductase [Lachnospiraceae bacterium]MDY5700404.1 FAD-dependent oxidoreductase [Lachnospiraceae bacterium]